VFISAFVATTTLFIQPCQIKIALALGFTLGASGAALEKKEQNSRAELRSPYLKS